MYKEHEKHCSTCKAATLGQLSQTMFKPTVSRSRYRINSASASRRAAEYYEIFIALRISVLFIATVNLAYQSTYTCY